MDTWIGGDYRIAIRAPDGELFVVKGVIQRLNEPELLRQPGHLFVQFAQLNALTISNRERLK